MLDGQDPHHQVSLWEMCYLGTKEAETQGPEPAGSGTMGESSTPLSPELWQPSCSLASLSQNTLLTADTSRTIQKPGASSSHPLLSLQDKTYTQASPRDSPWSPLRAGDWLTTPGPVSNGPFSS